MNPDTFDRELKVRLGPNYSLRRAICDQRWCIEQTYALPFDWPGSDDRAYRLQHGLRLVLDTPLAQVIPCPRCGSSISLPVFEKREFRCVGCVAQGSKRRTVDGYFPLVERTLLYLERHHPRRAAALKSEIDEENRQLALRQARERYNLVEDLGSDQWSKLHGGVSLGYAKAGTPAHYGA